MIIQLLFAKHSHRSMKFQALSNGLNNERRIDILWELSFNFNQATLNWPSTTQGLQKHDRSIYIQDSRSSIAYLPMIDIMSVPFLVLPMTNAC